MSAITGQAMAAIQDDVRLATENLQRLHRQHFVEEVKTLTLTNGDSFEGITQLHIDWDSTPQTVRFSFERHVLHNGDVCDAGAVEIDGHHLVL